jgi:hypothetical protein
VRGRERGYKEYMASFRNARVARIPVLAIALVAFAGCGEPPTPPGYTSKADKFRIGFASEPRVIDQPVGIIPTRLYPSRLYTVEGSNGAFTVNVIDIPKPPEMVAAASGKLLDDAKSDLLKFVGGTQTEGSSITLAGKYPGRAFTATAAGRRPGVMRARVYLAGTRLYKVSVFGTEDFANSDAATAFLESFMVLE